MLKTACTVVFNKNLSSLYTLSITSIYDFKATLGAPYI